MTAAKAWTIHEPCHGSGYDVRLAESFEFEAKAGRFTPKSERDEAMLELLFSIGLASTPEGDRFVPPQPAPPEPAPDDTEGDA